MNKRKTRMIVGVSGFFVFIFVIVFGPGASTIARAQHEPANAGGKVADRRFCNENRVKGKFGYTAQGNILPGSPLPVPPGPFASIGTVSLDGDGSITEHITNDNFNGFLVPTTNYTGTYSVNPDCTGTAVLVGRAPYKFTISSGGDEIYFMLDAPGTVVTGTAKRL